ALSISAMVFKLSEAVLLTMAGIAPSLARAMEIPFPIPLAPPVTMTTLSFNFRSITDCFDGTTLGLWCFVGFDSLLGNTQAVNSEFNHVARLQKYRRSKTKSDTSRCTSRNDVPWQKSHELTDVGDQIRNLKYKICRGAILHRL